MKNCLNLNLNFRYIELPVMYYVCNFCRGSVVIVDMKTGQGICAACGKGAMQEVTLKRRRVFN